MRKYLIGSIAAMSVLTLLQPVLAAETQQQTQEQSQTQETQVSVETQEQSQQMTQEGSMEFPDVAIAHMNHAAIIYLREKGIIGGYPDGTFKPEQVVNRAEALKMIMGITNFKYWTKAECVFSACGTQEVKTLNFSDTEKGAWYEQYLQAGLNNSIVQGYPDGTFKPAQTVNLVENLKMVLNQTFLAVDKLDAVNVVSAPFADTPVNQWYIKYVQYAKDKGLIEADASNNLNPAQGMTRAKLAELVYRVLYMDEKGMDKYSK